MDSKKTWILDGVFLLLIVLVGWFLIGYYLNYNYLATGYQDWIYHAFRIKSIQEWGIVSWDHKWANGINYWRSYQYIPHLLTLYTAKFLNIGITNAMILWTVTTFIFLRVSIYLLLKWMKYESSTAFLVTIISYTHPQQWHALKEFSIFIAAILIPIYVLIWIKSFNNKKLLILIASLSGFAWTLHLMLGLVLTGLTVYTLLLRLKFRGLITYLTVGVLIVSMLPVITEYFVPGYSFSNPYYSTPDFQNISLPFKYGGLGLTMFILYSFAGISLFLLNLKNTSWSRILYSYIVFFFLSIYLAKQGNLVPSLYKLQLGRGAYYLGLLSLFPIAEVLQSVSTKLNSRFYLALLSSFIAIQVVVSISRASEISPIAVSQINSVISYFDAKSINGSVYYQNDSEASYFSDSSMRLVGSYNEHLLPSPLSTRFKQIMSGGKSHLIVSQRQIDLINEYSKVLGVEYLVLPIKSPITKSLLSSETLFVYQDDVKADNSAYSVFRNEENTTYAYVMERSVFDANVDMNDLEKPDLRSSSYDVWDTEVESLSELFSSDLVQALPMDFVNTDELHIHTDEMNQFDDPVILVTQSYGTNWSVIDDASATIEPTSLRFMKIEPSSFNNTITLKNSWPSWHWPVQFLGFGSVIVSAIAVGVYEMTRKEKHAI